MTPSAKLKQLWDARIAKMERERDEALARLAAAEAAMQRQLEITYQYREQRDKAYGCVRNAIPGDYSTDSIDSDMGRMFQETIQKVMKRSDELQQRLAAAEALTTDARDAARYFWEVIHGELSEQRARELASIYPWVDGEAAKGGRDEHTR